MKRFIFTILSVLLVFGMSVSVSAAEVDDDVVIGHSVKIVDYFGNEELLYSFESGSLDAEPISTFSYLPDDSLPPAPHLVGREVPDISQIVADMQIPGATSFLFIDYGPNWEDTLLPDSEIKLSGRYVYVFYGLYSSSVGRPVTGGEFLEWTGHESYTWQQGSTPEKNKLSISGPFAVLCWDPNTNAVYQQSNCYNLGSTGAAMELIFDGIVSINDYTNSSFYPKAVTFADVDMTYFEMGNYDLTKDMDYYSWNSSWSEAIVHPDNEVVEDLWGQILNGDFTASDNPIIQFFAQSMTALAHLVTFFQELPDRFGSIVGFLPPVFSEFLLICFGLILGAFILKFAISILKR